MEISPSLNEKIRRISWICALVIIVQHGRSFGKLWHVVVTGYFTHFAVPMFFIISAILLYKDYECSFVWVKNSIRKRLRSLVIPYFLWCSVGLLLLFLPSEIFRASGSIDLSNPRFWLDGFGLFGLNQIAPKFAGHLWYVRLLFLFVVGALPIYVIVQKTGWLVPIFSAMLYVAFGKSLYYSSLSFFSMGVVLVRGGGGFLENKGMSI